MEQVRKKTGRMQRNQTVLPAAVRSAVWNTTIGIEKGMGYCFCCGKTPIFQSNFECGHIIARKKGGKQTIPNLRPICGTCNKSMGTRNMLEFMSQYGFLDDEKRKKALEDHRRYVEEEEKKKKNAEEELKRKAMEEEEAKKRKKQMDTLLSLLIFLKTLESPAAAADKADRCE